MRMEIVVAEGKDMGKRLSVTRPGIFRIGRRAGSDLYLSEDRHVSRQHCRIELTAAGVCRIDDSGSLSGTYVNGEQVQRAQLADGDSIGIGQTSLKVSLIGGALRIPGFILEEPLAGSGPGHIWSATSAMLGQSVALHFFSLRSASKTVEYEQRQRFLREASLCARTYHRGLLNFLDQNIAGDYLWFATEPSSGLNLGQLVEQRGPLSTTETIEVISQTLDIVAYLHQKGIVHRSLRPESLLVETTPTGLAVRLTDLATAKCFQPLELHTITAMGERGYPVNPFTAPEALRNFNKLDLRSDLYAVGAIFYFALVGRPPYEASEGESLLRTIVEKEPLALGEVKPELPLDLSTIVERAMDPKMERRYGSASEMLNALRRFANTRPSKRLGTRRTSTGSWPAKGNIIDHYEIISEVGRGRMSTVYRARDIRTERSVALKLLRVVQPRIPARQAADRSSPSRRLRRFAREVKLASQLNHPHIVTVYDVNLTDEPPYLVMELLDGDSLEDRLEQESLDEWLRQDKTLESWLDRQMPWSVALSLLRPLIQALAYTHQAGAVHRDVRPANILFTGSQGLDPARPAADKQEILKLADFGLAQWAVSETLTQSSDLLGVSAYLSPEQARGQLVDGRSDIFSVGLILFQAVTGVNPLNRGPLARTIYELGSDKPLDTQLLYQLDLPQAVINLIEQAIAKDADQRQATCEDLLAQVDACLELADRDPDPLPDLREWDGRSPDRPLIQQEHQIELNYQEQALLKTLFNAHNQIVVEAQFLRGLSGSRVLQVRPVDETGVRPYLPAIVKIGPSWLIRQEWWAYRTWVEKILPDIARLEGSPILGEQRGVLRYALVGSGIFPVQSLYDYYQRHEADAIRRLLADRLFRVLGKQYWQARRSDPHCHLQADYDAILPVNLLLEHINEVPPSAVCHRVEPQNLPQLDTQAGEFLQISGFVVTEIDVPGRQLTLNLPPTSGARAPASDQVPSGYRLRLTAVPHIERYRAGQIVHLMSGQVIKTRHDMLLQQAAEALPGALDLTEDLLPLSADLKLPNPLRAYQKILDCSRPVYRATIHGDLNLENILVEPGSYALSLIDFATVRRGHCLHDLLRLESEVVTKFIPSALKQADLPLDNIYAFYGQLHRALTSEDSSGVEESLHPELLKPFTFIDTVRRAAREYLFDPTDWAEYYQGLTLYLLGTLKFANLGESPNHPLSKQVAFWGAATAVNLLQK